MITIRQEDMAPHFTKFHVGGLPVPAVFHRFTAPDHGDPHDHPWSFWSTVLSGGYAEEIFSMTGASITVERKPGARFLVPASRIHRIVSLAGPECWTLIHPLPGPPRTSGFYQFRDDGPWHRFWHEPEFRPLKT